MAAVLLALLDYLNRQYGTAGMVALFALCFVGGITFEKYKQAERAPRVKLTKADLKPARLGSRLIAFGSLDDLSHLTEISNQPFEPIIIERNSVVSSMWWYFGVSMALGLILNIAANWLRGPLFATPGIIGGLGFGAAAVLFWVPARMIPVYYRIVPGRMDIMRFSLLRKKAKLLGQIDLSLARIRVEFARQTIEILSRRDGQLKLRLFSVAEPHEFVRGLFQAALCRHPAPPLPDDKLLG